MSENKHQGGFFYVEVKSNKEYKTFRARKFDEKVGIESVVGQREDGTWETVKWLICKDAAHLENDRLVADTEDAKELFENLGVVPKHIEGNRFNAKR